MLLVHFRHGKSLGVEIVDEPDRAAQLGLQFFSFNTHPRFVMVTVPSIGGPATPKQAPLRSSNCLAYSP